MSKSADAVLVSLRALMEGAPVSFALLASIAGRSERLLRERAKRENWKTISANGDNQALGLRLLVLSDRLVGELETASLEGQEAGGAYDKARIDALSAMLRMVEKLGEITRGPDRAKDNQKRNDEEMAAALGKIDERIVELASALAERMGGKDAAGASGLAGGA